MSDLLYVYLLEVDRPDAYHPAVEGLFADCWDAIGAARRAVGELDPRAYPSDEEHAAWIVYRGRSAQVPVTEVTVRRMQVQPARPQDP